MSVATLAKLPPLEGAFGSIWREFAAVGLLSMIANMLMLTPALYMLQIFDRVMVSRSELTLLAVSAIALLFLAVMAMAEWIRSRLLVDAGVRFDDRLNDALFRASLRAELRQSGCGSNQSLSDLTSIRQFVTGSGTIAIFDLPWTPVYVAVGFLLHPTLGWVMLAFVVLLVALAIGGQRLAARPAKASGKVESDVGTYVIDALRNAEAAESLGMVGDLRRRWLVRHRRLVALQSGTQRLDQHMTILTKLVRHVQQSLSLAVGALLAIYGEITIGSMIAASLIMTRAAAPLEAIVSTWSSWFEARAALDRLRRLLQEPTERATGTRTEAPVGNVKLHGVVATAPDRAEPILETLDREFPAGQVTAIIGPSASGKSTLARVLIGAWPHVCGAVLLDGRPVDEWNREALGAAIGYLPQDVELFEGTIAENIGRFGSLDASKVVDAARRTGMHETILRMPKGYDTAIGEGGRDLSGGQRQRIALARALYGDPRIVVLDEPDSDLDSAGDEALGAAIRDLRDCGRTVFVVSHRMGLIAIADRVLLLGNGAVKADGTPGEVFAATRGAEHGTLTHTAEAVRPPESQPRSR